MASSLRDAFRELLTTRYIPNTSEEHSTVETARAGCSVLQPQHPHHHREDVIENTGEVVELREDDRLHRTIHRIDETPKLVAKRTPIVRVNDEAIKVLRNLRESRPEDLRSARYDYYAQRWFHTTRQSELELTEHVLLHPNHRPHFFSMQCRHLAIEDIPRLVLKSLLSEPRETGQCLVRLAIQTNTDMPFRVLYSLLETMVAENDGFQLSDCAVLATLIEPRRNRNITHRLKTVRCKEYGELEPTLDQQGKIMSSRGTITCSVVGKRHVQTQITYINNAVSRANTVQRSRYIELEQTVKCMNRRVLITEDHNECVEFEVENEMVSLRRAVPPVEDLIDFLRSGALDDE